MDLADNSGRITGKPSLIYWGRVGDQPTETLSPSAVSPPILLQV